jgi:hypothetical protein
MGSKAVRLSRICSSGIIHNCVLVAHGGPDFAANILNSFEICFYGFWRSPGGDGEIIVA